MHYTSVMAWSADWTYRGDYIAKHAMTPRIADEALQDPTDWSLIQTHRQSAVGHSE